MPQVVLNTVPEDTRKHNQVIMLETLTKKQILRELVNVTQYPETTVLALAEEIPEEYRTPAKEMWTTKDYLESKGVTLDRSQKHRFANLVTQYYKEEHNGMMPRTISRPDDRGRWLLKLNGFETSDLPILDKALVETIGSSTKGHRK